MQRSKCFNFINDCITNTVQFSRSCLLMYKDDIFCPLQKKTVSRSVVDKLKKNIRNYKEVSTIPMLCLKKKNNTANDTKYF